MNLFHFRGDHIVPSMDEAFPKKKVEVVKTNVSFCHNFIRIFSKIAPYVTFRKNLVGEQHLLINIT
jgi:hypothetical protein